MQEKYKYFKNQINVINNNTEDDVKAEDDVKTEYGETIENVHQREIANIFKYGLMDRDFHLTNFDNRQLGQTNIVITYLEKNNIDVDERLFNSEKSKTKTEYDDKKELLAF